MKQLLQALSSDVTLAPPAGRVPSSTYACATVLPVHPAAFELPTQGTSGRTRTHRGHQLMVIKTNAHRRPPETPT